MRANRFTTPEELLEYFPEQGKKVEEARTALQRAVLTAELLTGRSIREKRGEMTVLARGQCVLLEDWPLTKFSPRHLDHLEELGVVFVPSSLDELTLTWTAGYEEGELPALYKMLIEAIATWIMTGEESTRELVADLVIVAREEKAKEESRRNEQAG